MPYVEYNHETGELICHGFTPAPEELLRAQEVARALDPENLGTPLTLYMLALSLVPIADGILGSEGEPDGSLPEDSKCKRNDT